MIAVAFVVLAGAGAITRATVGQALNQPSFPWGTLVVNVAGSLALGLIAGAGDTSSTLVGVALLGSMTTFSTLVVEALELAESGQRRQAAAYLTVSVTVGLAAAGLGLALSG